MYSWSSNKFKKPLSVDGVYRRLIRHLEKNFNTIAVSRLGFAIQVCGTTHEERLVIKIAKLVFSAKFC